MSRYYREFTIVWDDARDEPSELTVDDWDGTGEWVRLRMSSGSTMQFPAGIAEQIIEAIRYSAAGPLGRAALEAQPLGDQG